MEQKRDSRQASFDIQTEPPAEKLPFNLKAKIIAFQKGVSYREAFGLMLEQEVKDRAEERKENHSP